MCENNKNIDLKKIISQKTTVLIDFYASWCGPCQKLIPVLNIFAKENPDIEIIKIDVDLHREYMNEYNITSFPTLILFQDGEEKKRKIGYCSKEELQSFVE
ncbi:thioredoxin [Candidatus Phytoplasma fraxini]|uniref:Thioredoxin n=1 Tax=Ash yellows phytoplasma TaxID=35780 RepID=A0ABZ2UDE9_ASHYP